MLFEDDRPGFAARSHTDNARWTLVALTACIGMVFGLVLSKAPAPPAQPSIHLALQSPAELNHVHENR